MKKFIHILLATMLFLSFFSISVHADAEHEEEFNFNFSSESEENFINFAVSFSDNNSLSELEFFGTLGLSFYREALRQEFEAQNPNVSQNTMNLYLDSIFSVNTDAIINSINNNISSVRNSLGNLWNDFQQTTLAEGWRSVLDTIGDALTWWRPEINNLVSEHIAPNVPRGAGGASFSPDRFVDGFGGSAVMDFEVIFMMWSEFARTDSYFRQGSPYPIDNVTFNNLQSNVRHLNSYFRHYEGFFFSSLKFNDANLGDFNASSNTGEGLFFHIASPHFFINDSLFRFNRWHSSSLILFRDYLPYFTFPISERGVFSHLGGLDNIFWRSGSNFSYQARFHTEEYINYFAFQPYMVSQWHTHPRGHALVSGTTLEYLSVAYVIREDFTFYFRLNDIINRLDNLNPNEVTIINIGDTVNNNYFNDNNNSPYSPNRPGWGDGGNIILPPPGGGNNGGGDDGGGGILGLFRALLDAIASLANLGNTIISGILDGLSALFSNLFVPREGFFEENVSSISEIADERLGYRRYLAELSQLTDIILPRTRNMSPYAGAVTPDGFANISFSFLGHAFEIPLGDTINPYMYAVRGVMVGTVSLLLIFYNLKNIRRVIEL